MGAAVEGVVAGVSVGAPAAAGDRVEWGGAEGEAAEGTGVVEGVSDRACGIAEERRNEAGAEVARDHDQRGLLEFGRPGIDQVRLPPSPRLRELGAGDLGLDVPVL